MTALHDLHDRQGQSPWLDNLRRDWLRDGTLAGLVAQGIRGVTSNPTIFAKAIEGQDTYDEQFGALIGSTSVSTRLMKNEATLATPERSSTPEPANASRPDR